MVIRVNLRYRLKQFWQVVTSKPLSVPVKQEISEILSEAEEEIFFRCSNSDQWHSYRVLQTLRDAGHTHPALLSAALLHDAGKARGSMTVWGRTWIVIGEAFMPNRVDQWADQGDRWWQRPFVIRKYHAEWGAEMAKAAGSNPLTIDLIRRHQEPQKEARENIEDPLLWQLQWADGLN